MDTEKQALEQMHEAQAQGSTLKDYAAKIGLDVRQLYELRRRLVESVPPGTGLDCEDELG